MHPYSPSASAAIRRLVRTLACLLLFNCMVYADAVSSGIIQVSNLTITPGSGTVTFGSPWTAQAFAEAQNSLCGCQSQFNSSLGGIAQADASVAFAQGHALADASSLFLFASASVNDTGGNIAASAIGQSTLFNMQFMITGGSGPVDVSFAAMLTAIQSLMTDATGLSATSDLSFSLSVNGQNVLFYDSANQIGPNSSFSDSFSGPLDGSITLDFNQMNTISLQVETDPSGYNIPEPPSLFLTALGMFVPLMMIRRAPFLRRK